MLQQLICTGQRLQVRNGAAEAGIMMLLELIEIKFATLVWKFAQ